MRRNVLHTTEVLVDFICLSGRQNGRNLVGYIYGLCAPDSTIIRYVGQTTKSLKQRLRGHMLEAKDLRKQHHRVRWIRKVGQPVIVLLEETDNLDEAEVRWIGKLRAEGHHLVNSTDGGQSTSFKQHSLETRAKMSAARKGRVITWGDKISAALQNPETREKLVEAGRGNAGRPSPRKGKTGVSEETRAKLSASASRAWAEGRGKNRYTAG